MFVYKEHHEWVDIHPITNALPKDADGNIEMVNGYMSTEHVAAKSVEEWTKKTALSIVSIEIPTSTSFSVIQHSLLLSRRCSCKRSGRTYCTICARTTTIEQQHVCIYGTFCSNQDLVCVLSSCQNMSDPFPSPNVRGLVLVLWLFWILLRHRHSIRL